MNYGPLIFLAAFFAMASSWVGFVLTPQLQLGRLQQTNAIPNGAVYPIARPGFASAGLDVYRANGCAACHSQQVGQLGTSFGVALTDAGTNRAALLAALKQVAGVSESKAEEFLSGLPKTVLQRDHREAADADAKALAVGGAKTQVTIIPTGPDIARGWGLRRTVAEDYLYDYPVMLGSQRVGPDLANVGVRLPDANWHFQHLYAPRSKVEGSTMPPYRYLFETRRIDHSPSPDALNLPAQWAPPPGYEVVPKAEARSLVAYLLSLRADAPLFNAPLSVAAANPPADTNAPAGAATNAPAK